MSLSQHIVTAYTEMLCIFLALWYRWQKKKQQQQKSIKKQESLDSGHLLLILYRKTENMLVQIEPESIQHLNFDHLFKHAALKVASIFMRFRLDLLSWPLFHGHTPTLPYHCAKSACSNKTQNRAQSVSKASFSMLHAPTGNWNCDKKV